MVRPTMDGQGLAPSPVARLLLDLAERGAEGSVEVGGRRVVVQSGRVVDISPAEDDESLEVFVVRAKLVDEETLAAAIEDARAAGAAVADALLRSTALSPDAIRDARRGVWLDRLVRGLAVDEERGAPPNAFVPEPPRDDVDGVPLVPFVLDALARRAGLVDAGIVGAKAGERLTWEDSVHQYEAQRWAELPLESGETKKIASLLPERPSAAASIAALIRAGLARIVSTQRSAPPPPKRPPSIAPPSRPGDTLPPPLLPASRLDPGAAPSPDAAPLGKPRLRAASSTLEDPLDGIERRILSLEQSGASGSDRAAAWRELARVWQSELASLAEAARAYREAAAADPEDVLALEQSAILCAATGQLDLSVAYDQAILGTTIEARKKPALMRLARTALRAGDPDTCIDALMKAAKRGEGQAEPLELAAEVRRLTGDAAHAVRDAQRAARFLVDEHPGRARALLAWAYEARPDDPLLVSEYATSLSADGFGEASVAVLGDAADQATDLDLARSLRLEAAERAGLAGRRDLEADYLALVFHHSPEIESLHQKIVDAYAAAGTPMDEAVITEAVARAANRDDRAEWLRRAARAYQRASTSIELVVDLLTDALAAQPTGDEALRLLDELALDTGDEGLVLDAIERASRLVDGAGRAGLLAELGVRAAEDPDGSARALWAFDELSRTVPDHAIDEATFAHLRERARVSDEAIRAAERELARADPEHRHARVRSLASLLSGRPGERKRAMDLYLEALRDDPVDEEAATAFERLSWTGAEDEARLTYATNRLGETEGSNERVRLLRRIVRMTFRAGDHESCGDACRILLEAAPLDPEALARLERSTIALGDPQRMARALRIRIEATPGPRDKGRIAARLATLAEQTGTLDVALEEARQALSHDPENAAAALLRGRHASSLPSAEGIDALLTMRRCFGDSAPLLERIADAASLAADRDVRDEAIDTWCAVSPLDPEPAMRRLLWATATEDEERIRRAIVHALGAHGVDPDSMARALRRLVSVAGRDGAASLALRAVDRLGHRSEQLTRYALSVAGNAEAPEHRIAALERAIAISDKPDRMPYLEALAQLYQGLGRRAAEARTLLRILGVDAHHEGALDRLTEIYSRTGESQRLLAVLALRLEAADDPYDRQERLLDLAVASLERSADEARAAGFVARLVDESDGDPHVARQAASAMAAVADTAAGIRVLTRAGRELHPEAASPLFEEAVTLLERVAEDRRAALTVAIEGLTHCPRSAPLLLAFERLALELEDVELARDTYTRLVERAMGNHGRRALLYREARWLERAGDLGAALGAYSDAFAVAPTAGVLFTAIERLSDRLGEHRALAVACERLAARLPHPDAQLEMMRRAASIHEADLGDPARAFEVLFGALSKLGRRELVDDLRRLASAIEVQSGEAGRKARARLVQLFHDRAEQSWDDEDKARQLLAAAEILFADAGDHDAGRKTMTDALALVDGAHDVEDETRARFFADIARWLAPADPEAAAQKAHQALTLAPDDEVVKRVTMELGMPTPRVLVDKPVVTDSVRPPAPGPTEDFIGKRGYDPIPDTKTFPVLEDEVRREAVMPPSAAAAPTETDAETHTESETGAETDSVAESGAESDAETETVAESDAETDSETATVAETDSETATAAESDSETEPVAEPVANTAADPETDGDPDEAAVTAVDTPAPAPVARPGMDTPRTAASRLDFRASVADDEEMRLRSLMARDDLTAGEALAERLLSDAGRRREGLDVLLWIVRRDPARTAVLRRLAGVALELDAPAVAQTAAEIVSIFDARIELPDQHSLSDVCSYVEDGGEVVRDPRLAGAGQLLALVWEGAMPLFRKSAREAGTSGLTPLSPLSPSLLAKTYAHALRVLSPGEVSLYVRRTAGAEIEIVATHPPALIAEEGAESSPRYLPFRIGRAVELARPAHILLTALHPDEGSVLLDAVSAAFAPPDASPSVSRDAMSLAASLWDTIPSRVQAELRAHLEAKGPPPPFDELVTLSRESAARAGLLLVGSVRTAIDAMAAEGIDLTTSSSMGEDEYVGAVRASGPLRAMLSFALSDAFLAARSRAVRASRT